MSTRKPSARITLRIVLQHVQAMRQEVTSRFDKVEGRLNTMGNDIKRLEWRMDRNHSLLVYQIDNIDKRLDDIEVVQIPKLKKALRMR